MEWILFFLIVPQLYICQILPTDNITQHCPLDVSCSDDIGYYRCSCEDSCYLYNDCCSDMINQTATESSKSVPDIHYSCRTINGYNYYVFDRCPTNFSIMNIVNNCENYSDSDYLLNIPASGKTSKRVYRNFFCALCHGDEFILWNKCPSMSEQNPNLNANRSCDYYEEYLPPDPNLESNLHPCRPHVATCPTECNDTSLINSCHHNPMSLVFHYSGSAFRNKYCAFCNGLDVDEIVCELSIQVFSGKLYRGEVFSEIFNIYIKKYFRMCNSESEAKKMSSCPKDSVFDRDNDCCRPTTYHPDLNCNATRLNESEYHITNDGLLYLNESKRTLNTSEFSRDEQGISICIDNYSEVISKYSEAEKYITLVGLLISVPAIAVTILVYLCIPELRTLPGKMLISLLSTLFIAELLFLVSQQLTIYIVLCTSVAVVMHYSFLAAFFWMNVMSFDAWYTFSGLTKYRSVDKNNKRFLLYSVYAWLSPLLIILASLLLQYVPGEHGISPDYGKDTCWITNSRSLLLVFTIPVTIILSLNLLAFMFTARGIYLASKLSSKYLSKDDKTRFLVYIKLSLIMGLTWIFGSLYKFTEVQALSFVFCILNSFQGLFICLSFLLTRTVRRHFVGKCKCYRDFFTLFTSDSNKTTTTDVKSQSNENS